jgi:hypothetical protein
MTLAGAKHNRILADMRPTPADQVIRCTHGLELRVRSPQFTYARDVAMRRIITSAADAKYYPLLRDLISSIRAHSDIAIGILDVGLEPTQVAELGKVAQHIVAPGWDFPSAAPRPICGQ